MQFLIVFLLTLTAPLSSYAELGRGSTSENSDDGQGSVQYNDIDHAYLAQTSGPRAPKRCNFNRRSPFAVGLTFFNKATAKVEPVPRGLEVFYCHPTRTLKHAFDDYETRLKPLMAEQCDKINPSRKPDIIGFVKESPLLQPNNLQTFFLIRCDQEKQHIFIPAASGTPVQKGDIPYLSNLALAPHKHAILLTDNTLLTFTPKQGSTHLQASDTQMSFKVLNEDFSFDLSQVSNRSPKAFGAASDMFRNPPLGLLRASEALRLPKVQKRNHLRTLPSGSFPKRKEELIKSNAGFIQAVSG